MKPQLYLINGPLGAGKTTTLKQLLQQPVFKRARIIENEFANYSVDSEQFHEHEAKVETIAGVCICCSTGDELVEALTALASSSEPVIIEATGVANSLLLIEKLVLADLLSVYDLAHGLFVLDSAEFSESVDEHVMLHKNELLAADTVLISKADLISPGALDAIRQTLHDIGVKHVSVADEGKFDIAELDRASEMLDFYVNFDETIQNRDTDMNYTVINLDDEYMSSEKLSENWRSLSEQYGLRRLKGDFADTEGGLWHVEATPSQIRLSQGGPGVRTLVCIGKEAYKLNAEKLLEALR